MLTASIAPELLPLLQVVLGTESGMITSIVRKVQQMLRDSGRKDVEVEIVFPVSSQAITTSGQVGDMRDLSARLALSCLRLLILTMAWCHGSSSSPSCSPGQMGAAMSPHCLGW